MRICEFVLLSHFDIDRGSIVKHQYPRKMGISEGYVLSLTISSMFLGLPYPSSPQRNRLISDPCPSR